MENNWIIRKQLTYLFQTFIIQIRFPAVLICTMAGTNSDSQRIATGKRYKFSRFFRIRKNCILGIYADHIFYTGKTSQFRFHHYPMGMCIFNNLFSNAHIFFKWVLGAIKHDRSKSTINTVLAHFKAGTMIQMESYRNFRILTYRCLYQINNVWRACILSGTFGSLKNNRRLFFMSCFHNPLNDFHVIYIKCPNRIMTFICFSEHFFGIC